MTRVAILVGSLRRDSINLRLANAVAKLATPRFESELVRLVDLPMYNDDLWQSPPASVVVFKAAVQQADAVLFVTPEYNRSMPPVLKNAIDWGSRPKGENVWQGKPGAVIGASPGVIGAAVAPPLCSRCSGDRDLAATRGIFLVQPAQRRRRLQFSEAGDVCIYRNFPREFRCVD
jgi:hypothetical protein